MAKTKSTPSLPMSSKMQMPNMAKPAIKGAIKGAAKGAVKGAVKAAAKTMIKKKY
jgi:hypothetical protein